MNQIEEIIDALMNYKKETECPKCNGSGRKNMDNYEGYLPNGKYAQHTCLFCCGSGRVKATINLEWVCHKNYIRF